MANFKEASKQSWKSQGGYQDINAGSLQRIADSLEKMEQPYLRLLDDAEYLRRRYREQRATIETLHRRVSSLKGVITRMKNKAKK